MNGSRLFAHLMYVGVPAWQLAKKRAKTHELQVHLLPKFIFIKFNLFEQD